jgi:hypothetical protein
MTNGYKHFGRKISMYSTAVNILKFIDFSDNSESENVRGE